MPDRSTPTVLDVASPFDSATAPRAQEAQSTVDPPTALVRRDSFRELPPGSVVGEIYEIDARLGSGAMGEVYAARHLKLGKRVAIKVIGRRLSEDEAAIERFAMEARTLAQIQHPAIVAVDHVGELADGRAYFVMEFLVGETLFARLAQGRLSLAEALRVLDQLARGLEAAHSQGVIHRDLKPENVFLVHLPGEAPAVKLVDFGLLKLAPDRNDSDLRAERTQSGVAMGTPMYMSPEQMRGPDVDPRTDIYALGCIAYELLLGVPPFPHAKAVPALYAAHLHEAPLLPRSIWPEIPPQLDLALFAMLAKDPAYRPTLAQVRSVVAAVRTPTPSQPTPSQRAATEFVGPRAPKVRTQGLTIAAIALIALIGGITIGVTLTTKGTGSNAAPIEHVAPPITTVVPAYEAPSAEPVSIDPRPEVPAPRPRSAGSGARPSPSRQLPRTGSATVVTVVPVDASVDVVELSPPPPPVLPSKAPATIDRNQTLNPFANKQKRRTP
jgi:serine/threonine-protein kinase